MEGATVHQGEVYVMLSLDREICGSTMVARTGTELAVDGIENSPKEEAKSLIIKTDMP